MQTYEITKDWIVKKLISSLKALYKNERKLLIDELGERAVIFRLGLIMSKKFKPAYVCAEYNKKHDADGNTLSKSLRIQKTSYPDLLVFSNEENDWRPNKLVIEAKMDYQYHDQFDVQHDKRKIKFFTNNNEEYKYIVGTHLLLGKDFFIIAYYENANLLKLERYEENHGKWKKMKVSNNIDYNTHQEFRLS